MRLEALLAEELEELEEESGHAHGAEMWEWAGIWQLEPGRYTWTFEKVNGVYGAQDRKMKVVVLRAFDEGLEEAHELAEAILTAGECIQALDVAPADSCYDIVFDSSAEATVATITIGAAGRFAFFTEHTPSEFNAGRLLSSAGQAIGPTSTTTHRHAHEDHEDHGDDEDRFEPLKFFSQPDNGIAVAALVLAILAVLAAGGTLLHVRRRATASPIHRLRDVEVRPSMGQCGPAGHCSPGGHGGSTPAYPTYVPPFGTTSTAPSGDAC
mgnify:CR=1 FL=1